MIKLRYNLIQVFDNPQKDYRGNIAAVVKLKEMLETSHLQRMASDLAQPATSFIVPSNNKGAYNVRWFATDGEIDLCGHGSLAVVAYLKGLDPQLTECVLTYNGGEIRGESRSKDHASIFLKGIPVLKQLSADNALIEGLGKPIKEYWQTDNKDIVVLNSERDVREMRPDFAKLRERKTFGYAVTAASDSADFVSRTLVPHVGQLEDHATGSSHAALVPFWSKILGKSTLKAEQLSPRKGEFLCQYQIDEDIVCLSGHYSILAEGVILI